MARTSLHDATVAADPGGVTLAQAGPAISVPPPAAPAMVVMLAVGYFAMVTAGGMFAPALAALGGAFGVSTAAVGQLSALAPLTWAILAPLIGPWSDRWGRVPFVAGGLAVMGAGSLMAALAPDLAWLGASRLITGVGGAAFGPSGYALVADVFPADRRAGALGRVLAGYSAAAVLGLPAVAYITGVAGWRWAFTATGTLTLLVAAGSWLSTISLRRAVLSRHRAKAGERRSGSAWSLLIRRPRAALLLLGHLLHQCGGAAAATYTAAFLVDHFSLTLRAAALPLALIATGSVAGSLAGGRAAGARPLAPIVLACALTAVLAPAFLSGRLPLGWTIAVAAAASLAQSARLPAHLALLTEEDERDRGVLLGLNATSNQIGYGLGAAVGGAALAVQGYGAVGVLASFASVAACAVYGSLWRGTLWRATRQPATA